MYHRPAKLVPSKGSLHALDLPKSEQLSKHELNLKTLNKDSFITKSVSKLSTTLWKNGLEELVSLRDSEDIFAGLQSARSYEKMGVKLPPISNKQSNFQMEAFFPRNSINNISTTMPSLILQNKKYEKLILNQNEDFTKPFYLRLLKRVLQTGDDKMIVRHSGLRKEYSIKHSKKIINHLERELKSLANFQLKAMKSKEALPSQITEQYTIIKDLDSAIVDILDICDVALELIKFKKRLDLCLRQICDIAQRSNNPELFLYCIYIHAQICVARSEIRESISLFKQYKSAAVAHELLHNKAHAYKNLGKCFQHLRKHKVALTYFTKFLQMGWLLNSAKYELTAYDLIGKQFYYLGMLNQATYYHNKMASNKMEPKDSVLRQIGIYKVTEGKEHTQKSNPSQFVLVNQSFDRDREDSQEMSSMDEAIELPVLQEDDEGHRVTEAKEYGFGTDRKKGKKKMDRLTAGLIKSEIIKKHEEKHAGDTKRKPKKPIEKQKKKTVERNFENQEIKLKSPSLLNLKPTEQILISHLSRNRNLKNFSLLLANNFEHFEDPLQDSHLALGSTAATQVKNILAKFRINLILIKQSLEIYGIGYEYEQRTIPSFDRRGTEP